MPVDFTAGILVMYTAAAARANYYSERGYYVFYAFSHYSKNRQW